MKPPKFLLDVGNMDDDLFYKYIKTLSKGVTRMRERDTIGRDLRLSYDGTYKSLGTIFSEYDIDDELNIIDQFIHRAVKEKKKLTRDFLDAPPGSHSDEMCYKIGVYTNALIALAKRKEELEEIKERKKNK